jgi:hypothetical protein
MEMYGKDFRNSETLGSLQYNVNKGMPSYNLIDIY